MLAWIVSTSMGNALWLLFFAKSVPSGCSKFCYILENGGLKKIIF